MPQLPEIKKPNYRLITTRSVFFVSIIVVVLTVLSIWLFGLGKHRTIFENSILSISILALAFFLFLTIGLYKGIKLKDNLGKITDKIRIEKLPDLSGFNMPVADIGDAADGFFIILLAVGGWLLFSGFLLIFIWLFGTILWTMIVVFAAMLYWIFFRALRLVFKSSRTCKGNLRTSMLYGLGYTTLYIFWIYGIILVTHYLVK